MNFFPPMPRTRGLRSIMGSATLLAIMSGGTAAADPTIEIVSRTVDSGYTISGLVRSDAAFRGRATLEIARVGAHGSAKTRQSGTIDASSGDVVFARSQLSATKGDVIDAVAVLYDTTGTEVSRFSVTLD